MVDVLGGRMLLSHNFDTTDQTIPALSREEFARVFILGFEGHDTVKARFIDHPHWIVELLFALEQLSPQQVGEFCAQILADVRRSQKTSQGPIPPILILGGLKTSPPTSDSPDALQPGQWGVDVVETDSPEGFLATMGWEAAIAQRPADNIFKVELKG
jgi:hypothetical protein